MAALAPVIRQRFFDSNGDPLSGGKLYSYLAGTATPSTTYTDSTGGVPNTNPVVLDANGEADVWLGSGSYKFVLTDSLDVEQWTKDNVSSSASSGSASGWTEHAVTDAQSATNLSGETLNASLYSSADYEVEIVRGTTVVANGRLAVQVVNGTGRVVMGVFIAEEDHGVTFSVSQVSTTIQLKAALSTGPGDGTIKLRRSLVPV